jgi:hypothetical protein
VGFEADAEEVPRGTRLETIDVRGGRLRSFVHSPQGLAVMRMAEGRTVDFVRGGVSERQVRMHRPSYVNALLIQSRGVLVPEPCASCQNKMLMDRDAYAYPFVHCIRLPGHFGGCCGNCKWPDRASRCSIREGSEPVVREREQVEFQDLTVAAGTQDDPMELDDSEDEGEAAAPIVVLDEEGTAEDPVVL